MFCCVYSYDPYFLVLSKAIKFSSTWPAQSHALVARSWVQRCTVPMLIGKSKQGSIDVWRRWRRARPRRKRRRVESPPISSFQNFIILKFRSPTFPRCPTPPIAVLPLLIRLWSARQRVHNFLVLQPALICRSSIPPIGFLPLHPFHCSNYHASTFDTNHCHAALIGYDIIFQTSLRTSPDVEHTLPQA